MAVDMDRGDFRVSPAVWPSLSDLNIRKHMQCTKNVRVALFRHRYRSANEMA